MLNNLTLYVEAITHFLTVTDSTNLTDENKKSLLPAIGGPHMTFLFKHVRKVMDEHTTNEVFTNI